MNMQLVDQITKNQLRSDIPTFKPGDTLKVFVTIQEGNKSRVQLFEGVCIARKCKISRICGRAEHLCHLAGGLRLDSL